MVKFATISTFSKQFISKIKRDIRRNAQHQCAKHLSEKHATELHEYYLIFDFLRRTKSTEEIRLIVAAIARWHKREDAPFEFWLNVKKIWELRKFQKYIFLPWNWKQPAVNRWKVQKAAKTSFIFFWPFHRHIYIGWHMWVCTAILINLILLINNAVMSLSCWIRYYSDNSNDFIVKFKLYIHHWLWPNTFRTVSLRQVWSCNLN